MLELAISISTIRQMSNLDYFNSLIKVDINKRKIISSQYPLIDNREFINRINILPSRIYFGNEFCERLITDWQEIRNILTLAKKKNLNFTLVTPYVTNEGLQKLKRLFSNLNKIEEEIEVVVNDWGVLNLFHRDYKNLKPVLGRLLNKMMRMPRFEKAWPKLMPKQMELLHSLLSSNREAAGCSKKDSENLWLKLMPKQISFLQSSSISLNSYKQYLTTFNVKRVEFDLVPQGIDLDFSRGSLKASIYYPWTYITSGRVCEIGSISLPPKKKFTLHNYCQKECADYCTTWKSDLPFMSDEVFQKGNTVFMKCRASIETLKCYFKKGFNRIVYEPRLPF